MDQNLPKAIQAELEAAEALEQQMQQASTPQPDGNTSEPQQSAPEPVVTEPAQQEAKPETPSQPDETWQRRYEILQSKYNAEVPRYAAELKDQKLAQAQQAETLRQLQAKLDELTKKPVEPEKQLVTKSDEDTFGADIVDLARRVSKDENAALNKRLAAIEESIGKFASLIGKVEKVEQLQERTVEEKFYATLNAKVPDWEQVNADQKWLAWLAESDPLTGVQRQQILDNAANRFDGDRVAEIFNLFKKQSGTAEQKPPAKNELNRQVAPAKQGGSGSVPQADKIWTLAEYENAYDPRLSEKIGAKQAEALQAEADRALAEGRVR